jgi:hypothetical protein
MRENRPQACWLDLPAAVSVAAGLLDGMEADEAVVGAIERAAAALGSTAGLSVPTDEAKAACAAFLPVYESLLCAVTWRRFQAARRTTVSAWSSVR